MLVDVDGAGVGGRPHRRLGGEDDVARSRRRARRQLAGRRDGIVGDPQRQTVLDRGGGVEPHAEQQRGPRHLGADRALQHPRRTATGMDSEFLEARIEQGGGSGDADVGGQRQVQSGAHGGTVHRGDGGKRAVRHGEEAVVDHPQAVLGGRTQCREVGAGAERLAGAGHDHRVDVGIVLDGLDGRAQRRRDLGGHRVAAIGIVDRDERDAVFDIHQHQIRHGSRAANRILDGPHQRRADQLTSDSACARRSLPDGVFGMTPGWSTTTLRGRTSTSAKTSWAT